MLIFSQKPFVLPVIKISKRSQFIRYSDFLLKSAPTHVSFHLLCGIHPKVFCKRYLLKIQPPIVTLFYSLNFCHLFTSYIVFCLYTSLKITDKRAFRFRIQHSLTFQNSEVFVLQYLRFNKLFDKFLMLKLEGMRKCYVFFVSVCFSN